MRRHLRCARSRSPSQRSCPLSACSLVGGDDSGTDPDRRRRGRSKQVVLVTHESFALPKKLSRQFEAGVRLRPGRPRLRRRGHPDQQAGAHRRTTRTGDVAFGVDNTFASRALDEGVFAPYAADAPGRRRGLRAARRRRPPADAGRQRATCASTSTPPGSTTRACAPPETLDDLADPAYQDLFVLPGAATSSPGLAFLLATIAEYGDDWPDYWTRPDGQRRQAHVTAGPTPTRSTSPRAAARATGRSCCPTTPRRRSRSTATSGSHAPSALLDTCFRQVEYAGVLEGADEPRGRRGGHRLPAVARGAGRAARRACTSSRSTPASSCPAEWAQFAVQPDDPLTRRPRPRSPRTATTG